MGFLDKAKAHLKELESGLNNLTSDLGIAKPHDDEELQKDLGEDNNQANSISIGSSGTSTSIAAPTPASSSAPSVKTAKMATKLPLAVRKEVRDKWETKVPELEAELSTLLGVPWTMDVDMGKIFTYCEERRQKENPGNIMRTYIEKTIENIKKYIAKYGDDGKNELNTTASAHTISISESEKVTFSGCEIVDGSLRILFAKTHYGSNIDRATEVETLSKAVNAAGAAGAGASTLDFDARTSIKDDYDPKIADVRDRLMAALGLPSLTISPNFEANFATLKPLPANILPRDWTKRLGAHLLMYFDALATTAVGLGFDKDEMMQEALAEAVENNEVSFQVVEKLTTGTYNEVIIEDGVLFIRTVPKYYTANIRDVGKGLVDLL